MCSLGPMCSRLRKPPSEARSKPWIQSPFLFEEFPVICGFQPHPRANPPGTKRNHLYIYFFEWNRWNPFMPLVSLENLLLGGLSTYWTRTWQHRRSWTTGGSDIFHPHMALQAQTWRNIHTVALGTPNTWYLGCSPLTIWKTSGYTIRTPGSRFPVRGVAPCAQPNRSWSRTFSSVVTKHFSAAQLFQHFHQWMFDPRISPVMWLPVTREHRSQTVQTRNSSCHIKRNTISNHHPSISMHIL